MNLKQIEKIVEQGESTIVEFKKSTGLLHAAFNSICAFLNGDGGIVLIGVTDSGKIIGQEVSDKTYQEIANEISKLEQSAQAQISINYVTVVDKNKVIVIKVKSGPHKPYTYDGRPFHRVQSTSQKMPQHRYEQLIVERGQLNHSWEERIADGYKLDDLDYEEIYKTVADAVRENRMPASMQREDVTEILNRLDLMSDDKLKRAAIVLYSKQESIGFNQCMVKMARFKGTNKLGDFIDNQQIQGNAFHLLSEVDAFFRRHLPIASFFKTDQFKRIDKPTLPVIAVREALINAICHRDYSDSGTDISVAIFDDKVEIWNSGSLPSTISIRDLKYKHESVLRNKLTANVFYVRGLIEKWGIGTNRMIDLCKKDGIPEPKFEERTGGLAVIFKFKEPIGGSVNKLLAKPELNLRQETILEIIKKYKLINIKQISSELTEQVPNRTIQADLAKLKAMGLINCKGKGRAIVWVLLD
ncbi:MAG: putative DNA binding domain-containing protein [Gammaproteobacteria bacterium]|nr:putative DNA binding domain-containing protein [Gammaproteobacteria bacterium]